MSTSKTMELWDKVCKTDPKMTKKVNQRGGFTAIDAQYQFQEATRAWGPYGSKWGVKNLTYSYLPEGEPKEVALDAMFYYPEGEFEIGADIAYRLGNDTRKKLLTDLTTKALSKLGFNADVFMGKFDDNKYLAQVAKEFAPKPAAKPAPKQEEAIDRSGYSKIKWEEISTKIKVKFEEVETQEDFRKISTKFGGVLTDMQKYCEPAFDGTKEAMGTILDKVMKNG